MNKFKGGGLYGISSRLILDCAELIALHISIIAPAGISPRGEIPRRRPSNSRVY